MSADIDAPVRRNERTYVKSHPAEPKRAAFEAWWRRAYHPRALQEMEAGCYLELSAGLAWDAWNAAIDAEREATRRAHMADKDGRVIEP